MAERRGHGPHAALSGGISLETNARAIAQLVTRSLTAKLHSSDPGTLVQLTFHCRKGYSWQDLHPQPPHPKRGALSFELQEHLKSVPGRICTRDLLIRNQPLFLLSYGDKKVPMAGLAPALHRF